MHKKNENARQATAGINFMLQQSSLILHGTFYCVHSGKILQNVNVFFFQIEGSSLCIYAGVVAVVVQMSPLSTIFIVLKSFLILLKTISNNLSTKLQIFSITTFQVYFKTSGK